MTGHRLGQQNPYLFLVGCPRPGTTLLQTLLQRMLDHHPDLAVSCSSNDPEENFNYHSVGLGLGYHF